MFVEVQALQGLCYIVIPYSTKNKSSMSMSMSYTRTVLIWDYPPPLPRVLDFVILD